MNFRRRQSEAPEINLIPFIDVLLVVLIFLMLSTTYSRLAELQITLPTADADKAAERPQQVLVGVTADGRYTVNNVALEGRSIELLTAALSRAAGPAVAAGAASGAAAAAAPVVIVSADALAAHQSVVNVMDAARRANLPRLTFATQLPAGAPAR